MVCDSITTKAAKRLLRQLKRAGIFDSDLKVSIVALLDKP